MKLSICIFLNILLKTVILNYSTIWLLTPMLSKKLYYNMSVLCLYLCVCMSVANIGQYNETRSSKFPWLFTMPIAVAWYSSGHIAIRHALPVLWMTSCFHIMTKSQKLLHHATLYASKAYPVVVCLSVCLSVTSRCVSKRLNRSSWFRYGSFLSLCCEVRVSPKIQVFPSATLSQILYLTWKISPKQVSRVINEVHWRSSWLTTLTTCG